MKTLGSFHQGNGHGQERRIKMNRPLKITSALIVMVVVFIIGLFWQGRRKVPEKLFKTTINEINNELKEPSKKDIGYFISRLQYVVDNYPKSIWADDAQRIMADLYSGFDPERAIDEYQKIIEKFPDSKIEEWTLKNCPPFVTFLSVINKIPAGAESQALIADIYYIVLKNYPKAIEEYQKVIDFVPDVGPSDGAIFRLVILFSYHQIAKSYEKLGEIEKAIKTYQSVLDRFPDAEVTKIIRTKIEELKSQS